MYASDSLAYTPLSLSLVFFRVIVSLLVSQATITEISDATEVDLRKGRDEAVLQMLQANPKVHTMPCDCFLSPVLMLVTVFIFAKFTR